MTYPSEPYNHPHWHHHYVPTGAVFTACDRRSIEVTNRTDLVSKVTCRWCLQSDEYLAQSMEQSLIEMNLPDSIIGRSATDTLGVDAMRLFDVLVRS
jgi:hypothetical protein